ncbi:MAG: GNAT family N-acetyltransferase [Gemmatimonadetes bacterium]|nr:GNAT family N-acetyltransferase [Gemmatimonadota bacterium]
MMTAEEFTIRPLESRDDFLQCVALQHETWGEDFEECVPPSILQVSQKVGGVSAGAFDADGRLVGFVFGLSGVRHGRLAHWSDMLAVREELRGRGLGQRLKAYQLSQLLERGIQVAYWTYDPLEAGNANININRLAAFPVEYVPNMYGHVPGKLHAGLDTDRFVVEWHLTDPLVEATLTGKAAADADAGAGAPIVNTEVVDGVPTPRDLELPDASPVRVEIPRDVQALKEISMETAESWRANTRRALMHYLGRAYRVTGFQRDAEAQRCFYVLTRG